MIAGHIGHISGESADATHRGLSACERVVLASHYGNTLSNIVGVTVLLAQLAAGVLVGRELRTRLAPLRRTLLIAAGVFLAALVLRLVFAPWDPLASQGVGYARTFGEDNRLWGWLLSALAHVGVPRSVEAAQWVNLVISSLIAAMTFLFGRVVLGDEKKALAAGLLMAAWPPSINYATALWEAPVAGLGCILAALFVWLEREHFNWRTLLAVNLGSLPLVLARKEGCGLYVILLLTLILPQLRRTTRSSLPRLFAYAPPAVIGFAAAADFLGAGNFFSQGFATVMNSSLSAILPVLALLIYWRRQRRATAAGTPLTPPLWVRFLTSPLGVASALMAVLMLQPDNQLFIFSRALYPMAALGILTLMQQLPEVWPTRRPRHLLDPVLLIFVALFVHGAIVRWVPHNERQELEFLRRTTQSMKRGDIVVTTLESDLKPVDAMQVDDKMRSIFQRLTSSHIEKNLQVVSISDYLAGKTRRTMPTGDTYLYVGIDSHSQMHPFVHPHVSELLKSCEWRLVDQAEWRNVILDMNEIDDNYANQMEGLARIRMRWFIQSPFPDGPLPSMKVALYKATDCEGS